MSHATTGGQGREEHGMVRQEPDHVPAVPVVLLILAALALIAIGVGWPWAILARSAAPAPVPRFGEAPRAAPDERAGAYLPGADPLERFEWVDRERGTVALPIAVATELWLERHASRRGETEPDRGRDESAARDGESP
ncbi:MAG TPA: hypothetical protein VMS76_18935 [Planctomycetota bacterium]|nr:hypothetical protein [Planctomycetota bacterium]